MTVNVTVDIAIIFAVNEIIIRRISFAVMICQVAAHFLSTATLVLDFLFHYYRIS